MNSEKHSDAIDLSHHLSNVSKARAPSPLKKLQKYVRPGLISMAGGTPHADYFPFAKLSGDILIPNTYPLSSSPSARLSWFWKLFGAGKKETETVSVAKWPTVSGDLNLAALLQYSPATGDAHLAHIIKEFTAKVYQPAYSNFTTLVSAGNTDGWGRVALTLLNPGEGFLASEWTYPSAMSNVQPYGIKPVPVGMDGQGMRADALRDVLANWDETAHGGMKRPHVMYLVPVGQNPTGATMQAQRKREIYEVCVEFDVVIVEDDPYYFLQLDDYVPQGSRSTYTEDESEEDKFISSLAPSFVKFDYQGRVIRLDTFSKTVAPGCRLGWFTCNPIFAERLERVGETTTQSPCGFGQAMVASLLLNWKYEGYVRWLRALRIQYQKRRDFWIDSLANEFRLDLTIEHNAINHRRDVPVYYAILKPQTSAFGLSEKFDAYAAKPLFSFIAPSSGMFVWASLDLNFGDESLTSNQMKLHLEDFVPEGSETANVGINQLEDRLWVALADAGVLFAPGVHFSATELSDDKHGDGHFRVSFSGASEDEMKKAASIFATVFRKFIREL